MAKELMLEVTVNGTPHYVALPPGVKGTAHFWKPYVLGIDPIRWAPQYDYGGYCAMQFGDITFSPDMFAGDWPPPVECSMAGWFGSDDTEVLGAELVTNGTFEAGGTGGDFNGGAEIDDGTSDDFTGWTGFYSDVDGYKVEAVSDVHAGSVAVKLTKNSQVPYIKQEITVEQGEIYKISFWAKTGGGSAYPRIYTYSDGEGAGAIDLDLLVYRLAAAEVYAETVSYCRAVTDEKYHLIFAPQGASTETIFLDNVSVRKVITYIEHIFDSRIHLQSFDKHRVTYSIIQAEPVSVAIFVDTDGVIWQNTSGVEWVKTDILPSRVVPKFLALDTVTNFDGETVVLPRALGTVKHQQPVRLADDGNDVHQYHTGYTSAGGASGGGYGLNDVYDDGVEINSQYYDADQFQLQARPVGEITIYAASDDSITNEVTMAQWACQYRLGLNLHYEFTSSYDLKYWVKEQEPLIGLIGRIYAFTGKLLLLHNNQLYLNRRTWTTTSEISPPISAWQIGTKFFSVEYDDAPRYELVRQKWVSRDAVEETIGKYIKETKHEQQSSDIETDSAGEIIEGDGFLREEPAGGRGPATDFVLVMNQMLSQANRKRQQITIDPDLLVALPWPGDYVSWVDNQMYSAVTATEMEVFSVTYDFVGRRITLGTRGDYS